MNAYLESVIENVKAKHANEFEFVQTVEEVLSSLEPVISLHPEYEKADLLNRMVEPERMFTLISIIICSLNKFLTVQEKRDKVAERALGAEQNASGRDVGYA